MERKLFLVRGLLVGFMAGLVISGITAFPLPAEVKSLATWSSAQPGSWIDTVRLALLDVQSHYPFIFYGTDWLAFGHIVIALAFIGPIRDPVKNKWVVEWAMIACALVIPLALICGPIRGIPLWWRLIDCSFGVVGILPLAICRRYIADLEKQRPETG